MFLFKCCQEFHTGIGYEVQREKKTDFCNSLKEINTKDMSAHLPIRKIKKSEYEQVF